jgi:transcription elongation factor GreA
MNNKPTYLSKEGLEKLHAELDEMVAVKRPEVANRIHDAKEHGDLSENAEYEDAKNEQAFVEGRIQTLEALIKNATIIAENHSTDHVQIGSTVGVESDDGKETFTIVGSTEAKPADGKISNESPVGRALLGKKKGAKVVVKVPAGDFTYKIVSITEEGSPARGCAEGASWTGRTNSRIWCGMAAPRSSTTRRHRRARCMSGRSVDRSSSTRSPGRCAPAASRRRCSTASMTSTRWMRRRF